MKKIPDHFTVDGYEVRFLQSAPVTVCVIRSLTDLEARYTGIAVCNPHDKWDEATGRHKAMKSAFCSSAGLKSRGRYDGGLLWAMCTCDIVYSLPIKAIQKAYWEHYKDIE